MRKHLVNPLRPLICAVAGLTISLAGCQKKIEPVEPIPAAAPLSINQFVRSWAVVPNLKSGDSVKQLHAREDRIFTYTTGGEVLAMDRGTGEVKWMAQIRTTDRGGMRPPVVLKDSVVIPTSSTLEIFDPNEGQLTRSIALKVATRSDAIGWNNLIFLGGDYQGAGRVGAIDITRPYVPAIWQLMIPQGGLKSTPAMFEEVVFIGGGNGYVYAVSGQTREALWPLSENAFKTEGPIVADLAADETGVYVASTDTRFYVLNRGNGRLKWQYFAGRPLTGKPILTETQVFLPLPDGSFAAFDKNDGAFDRVPMWIAPGVSQFLVEDDKHVYFRRAKDNAIVALDKQTGEQRFENNRRDLTVFATNTKADGVIFAASKTNRVLAIKPVLRPGVVGELVWNEVDATDGFALAR